MAELAKLDEELLNKQLDERDDELTQKSDDYKVVYEKQAPEAQRKLMALVANEWEPDPEKVKGLKWRNVGKQARGAAAAWSDLGAVACWVAACVLVAVVALFRMAVRLDGPCSALERFGGRPVARLGCVAMVALLLL